MYSIDLFNLDYNIINFISWQVFELGKEYRLDQVLNDRQVLILDQNLS